MSPQQNESRSTAYVFGELSPEETTQFEQELEQSTELQSEVASIREAVVALEAEFDSQSTGVNTAGREKIEQAMSGAVTSTNSKPNPTELNKTEGRSGGRRLLIGLAIAASLLVIVGLVYPQLAERSIKSDLFISQAKELYGDSGASVAGELQEYPEPAGSEDGSSEGGGSGRSTRRPNSSSKAPDRASPQSIVNRETGRNLDVAVYSVNEEEAKQAAPAANKPVGNIASGVAPSQTELSSDMPALAQSPSVRLDSQMKSRLSTRGQSASKTPQRNDAKKSEAPPAPAATYSIAAIPDTTAPHPLPSAPQSPATHEPLSKGKAITTSVVERQRRVLKSTAPRREIRTIVDAPRFDADQGTGPGEGGDRHDVIQDNPFMEVKNAPLSTFSIDVDTAAYAKVRMYLMQQNSMPRPDAVRIEELLNYFSYDYAPPEDDHPFAAAMEVAACPWNSKHRLARIGIKGKVIEDDRPSSNLVFLLDVSGSMNRPNKLPLVVEGMKMLVDQLTENDSVAIVVYAGAAGLVLDSTTGDRKQTIIESLERLRAGGSTNGGQGITLAYQIARDNFITGGTNRVILCSDGDFNVGVTGTDELVRIAEQNAKGNIFLSVLGFGMGNHNDAMMEQISNKGNGNYAFIDSKAEAQKVLVEEMGATLVTIAKDVKIQVEFNETEVAAYRLIGYENRMLAAQDFNDDEKDAGEIGAGHTVTALYELVPAGVESDVTVPPVDDLKYRKKTKPSQAADSGELLTLKLRYKQPEGTKSTLIEFPVTDSGKSFTKTDPDFQFAASVAAFGMLLRNSPHKGDATYAGVEEIANGGLSNDTGGYRAEFLQMVARAKQLSGE